MKRPTATVFDHLSDDELFALAVPASGAPEPLPVHLSECLDCSRSLAAWKAAVHELGAEDDDVLGRRAPEEWRAAEDATLAAIGRAGTPGRGRAGALKWALPAAAAAVLLLALLIGGRPPTAPVAFDDTAGLSAQDRSDDALLREVDRLASGEETANGWSELAPDPAVSEPAPAAENRS